MYVALMNIGRQYAPGELISDELTPETAERLLNAGAIEEVAPAADEAKKPKSKPSKETEAPEVDVMAGIVPDAGSEEKPKKGGRRKKE